MDYQPLNAENNEIRLVYFTQDKHSLTSSANATDESPQGIVQLDMRTVSFNDYSQASRAWMESAGTDVYKITDYLANNGVDGAKIISEQDERATGIQQLEKAVDALYLEPNVGRWSWGDYYTLSYTWGDASKTRTIIVNGKQMKATENLEAFLRSYIMNNIEELSNEERRVGYWIDAICINQNDVGERNDQVKRMSDIYAQSSGATVWLGTAADNNEKAMDVLGSIAKSVFNQRLETRQDIVSYLATSLSDKSIFSVGIWKAFQALFSRPYWSRLWVIQEIALSIDNINITCGNSEISWVFLVIAVNAFACDWQHVIGAIIRENEVLGASEYDMNEFMSCVGRIQQLRVFRDAARTGLEHVRLDKLLAITRGAKQADPKDKVYGILSLVDPSLSAMITPDYTLTTSEVFFDFAKAAINHSGSLDMITRQGRPRPGRTLPSWVPDWAEDVAAVEMTEKLLFQTSKNSQLVISFEDQKLIARGFIIDQIDGLGSQMPPAEEELEALADLVIQPSQNQNPYKDEAGLRNALWRTLVLNRDSAGDVAPDCYAGLLDVPLAGDEDEDEDDENSNLYLTQYHMMREFNGDLRIGDRTFEEYFPVGTDVDAVMAGMKDSLDPFHRVFNATNGRRLVITAQGFIGMARNEVQRNDVVCVLLGCSVPIVLRPSADRLSYTLVGESYIHGIMDGEVMEWLETGQNALEDFVIC